ncbi:MAG: purine-binding chemotaxis protein CheW [Planctomycetes bacterium]|nr:purine-binding chemotaxis protein CheW [Planctomycetota bacterium]
MSQPTSGPMVAGSRTGSVRSYTTFRLRSGLFGTATSAVKEITALPPLTPIPHAPAAVRGYVNLRGHIVLVVDLHCLLQREPAALRPESRLIVFKAHLGDAFGILVEQIGDIVELSDEQTEAPHAGTDDSGCDLGDWPEHELIRSVGKLDGALLSILEAHQLRPRLERAVAGTIKRQETDYSSGRKESSVNAS